MDSLQISRAPIQCCRRENTVHEGKGGGGGGQIAPLYFYDGMGKTYELTLNFLESYVSDIF
jgi:hypothetical protein